MGRELLIIALNGDSVVAEGTTHYPATLLNHHRKRLALHTHAFCSSGPGGKYMGFFCLHLKFIGGLVTFSKDAAALTLL